MKRKVNNPEDRIIKEIDKERVCRDELATWMKLINSKNFCEDLDKQDRASLIARGMHIKLEVITADELLQQGEIDQARRIIARLSKDYGSMYDKKEGRTDPPGGKDNPFKIEIVDFSNIPKNENSS